MDNVKITLNGEEIIGSGSFSFDTFKSDIEREEAMSEIEAMYDDHNKGDGEDD